jgi:hypothetical protein
MARQIAIRASSCLIVTGFISMASPNPDAMNFWSRLEERLQGLPSILPDEEGIAKIVTGITIPKSVRDSHDEGDFVQRCRRLAARYKRMFEENADGSVSFRLR